MSIQDLNVLVNLAERARQAGLIKFDEFEIVGTAIKNAITVIKTEQEKAEQVSESSTPEESAPKKATSKK